MDSKFCVICLGFSVQKIRNRIYLSHLTGRLSKINTKLKIHLNKSVFLKKKNPGTKKLIFMLHANLQVMSSGSICQKEAIPIYVICSVSFLKNVFTFIKSMKQRKEKTKYSE